MPTFQHGFRTLLATTALALFCGSCSFSDAGQTQPGVASLEEATETTLPIAEEPTTDVDLANAAYRECLSELGINLPTPPAGDQSAGVMILGGPVGGGQGPDIEGFDADEFDTAVSECEQHLAGVDADFRIDDASQTAIEDSVLAFSRCMEDEGYEIPPLGLSASGVQENSDPNEITLLREIGGPSINEPGFDFAAFEKAQQACSFTFSESSDPSQVSQP